MARESIGDNRAMAAGAVMLTLVAGTGCSDDEIFALPEPPNPWELSCEAAMRGFIAIPADDPETEDIDESAPFRTNIDWGSVEIRHGIYRTVQATATDDDSVNDLAMKACLLADSAQRAMQQRCTGNGTYPGSVAGLSQAGVFQATAGFERDEFGELMAPYDPVNGTPMDCRPTEGGTPHFDNTAFGADNPINLVISTNWEMGDITVEFSGFLPNRAPEDNIPDGSTPSRRDDGTITDAADFRSDSYDGAPFTDPWGNTLNNDPFMNTGWCLDVVGFSNEDGFNAEMTEQVQAALEPFVDDNGCVVPPTEEDDLTTE